MFRLLVVDNETYLVDSLIEMIKEKRPDLELYKAYSAIEALQQLSQVKIDIVLTDIQMPGMTGLELQKEVNQKWPRAKVIILSGYSDFSYIQQAMQQGGVEYVLKSEGDEKILAAIDRAMEELQEQFERNRLLMEAESRVIETRPLLQNEYFKSLIQGHRRSYRILNEQFANLQLPFLGDSDVLMAIGRVDTWPKHISVTDWPLIIYAIQNVADESMSSRVVSVSITYEENKIVWFIQPKAVSDATNNDAFNDEQQLKFVMGMLEQVQEICYQLLKVKVSIIVDVKPFPWKAVHQRFSMIYGMMNQKLIMGGEMRLVQVSDQPEHASAKLSPNSLLPSYKFEQLSNLLESGNYSDFITALHEATAIDPEDNDQLVALTLVYYSLVPIFLHYIAKRPELELEKKIDYAKLTRFDLHASWSEAVLFLRHLAETLLTSSTSENDMVQQSIQKIHKYIEQNLHENLSLTSLGEVTGYNPSYLSRLYKQMTGRSLFEYITEVRLNRAKKLLMDNRLKMTEIAEQIGFTSEHYFYRFFKKETSFTPVEYRELNKS